MIESKRALALEVVVSSLSKRVVGADQDLAPHCQTLPILPTYVECSLTFFPLPGSLTVVNCSSLYF